MSLGLSPRRRTFNISSLVRPVTDFFSAIYQALITIVDFVMHPLQDRVGVRGMAYIFVLPNLLIFGIFILLRSIFTMRSPAEHSSFLRIVHLSAWTISIHSSPVTIF
jgi:hypothetical protein